MPRKKKEIEEIILHNTESEGEYEEYSPKEEEIKQEIKQEIKPIKTKKPISDERKQHLDNIRVKALEAKRKQKELTLKAKLLKTVEKEDAAKKYDDYIASKQAPPQPIPQPIQQPPPQPTPQPTPQKKIKKKIYEDDDDDDDESLNHLLYVDNKKKLHERVLNERIKASILSYQNALMPQRY